VLKAAHCRNKFIAVALPLKAINRSGLAAVNVRVPDIVGDETLVSISAAD